VSWCSDAVMPDKNRKQDRSCVKAKGNENLRPAAILAAASGLFTLLFNLGTVDRSIAHLLVVGSFLALQDVVDLLDPTLIAFAPKTGLIRVFRQRLKPVEIALGGRQELQHENTTSWPSVVSNESRIAGEDQKIVFGFDNSTGLPAEVVQ